MEYKEILKKAEEASKLSYSKYSKFSVGACILAKSGKTYTGCNVENASYGLSICAERNAIFHAVACGEREFKAIAIFSPNTEKCSPCGACRQVIAEFGNDIDIIMQVGNSYECKKIDELLPESFNL